MQVSVEKISLVERRLTILVPANTVEEAYAKKLDYFAKNANLKGFRPGKAPINFIRQRFGENARKEALSEVIEGALREALKENNLQPINVPEIEPKVLTPDQPLEFIASFEVLPQIEQIQFAVEKVEKPLVEIKEEDIDQVIQQLTKQFTRWHAVERPAQEKDRVVIDYHAIKDGEADLQNRAQDYPLELGSKIMMPGFEEGLCGAVTGEERTLHLKYPDELEDTSKAGQSIDLVVNVKQILEAETPNLDRDFIEKLGIKSGNLEDFKKQIKQTLELERDRLIRENLKQQLFSELFEQNPIEIPKSLIAREAKNIHDEVYKHNHNHQHSENEMSSFNELAKKRVALGLLINEFAKQNALKPDKDKVQQRVLEIASAYEDAAQVVKYLSTEGRAGIEAQIMEDQVLEKLMTNLNIIEKIMSYKELQSAR